MIPPYAMLVAQTFETAVRGRCWWLSGPSFGRAPEPRDPLRIASPFAPKLMARVSALAGRPRGAERVWPTVGINPVEGLTPEDLRGAIVLEDGVFAASFTARLRTVVPNGTYTARLQVKDDRASALVRIVGPVLNLVVVGSGLSGKAFWNDLVSIAILGFDRQIGLEDVVPIWAAGTDQLCQLIPLMSYDRAPGEHALALAPTGPVLTEIVDVWSGDRWSVADVIRSPRNVAQVWLPSDIDRASPIAALFPLAA